MGRLTEIQTVLQHHHIGGVLDQWPGLLLTDDLRAGEWRTQAHAALNLLGFQRGLRTGAVMHQVAAEEARQFLIEQTLLLLEQQAAQRAVEPLPGGTDQLQPVGIGLGEGIVGHGRVLMGCSFMKVPAWPSLPMTL